ncbi:hypothetical protein [Accumulibacter sp.]|uniref:hypothetical protein n=1 Tax=Accumulibacter sp. TaxID=2053492 RepID=UPI00262E0F3C|nr:hypothetical protein [Accumulibacter sp.]
MTAGGADALQAPGVVPLARHERAIVPHYCALVHPARAPGEASSGAPPTTPPGDTDDAATPPARNPVL